MPKLRLVLIVALASSLAMGCQHQQEHPDSAKANTQAGQLTKPTLIPLGQLDVVQSAQRRAIADAQSTLTFVDRSTTVAIPRAYPRPVSDWSANERQLYEKMLVGNQYDVLVAPLQVNGWAFDRASRGLMSAELTDSIAKALSARVPDGYLIAKVLGEEQRQYPREELYRLAKSVGAKRIIWGALGHDLKGSMTVTILSQLRPEVIADDSKWSTPIVAHSLNNIAFDADHSAIESFELRIPELLRSIDIDPTSLTAETIPGQLDIAELPASPRSMTEGDDNPARAAYSFLLFSALTPEHIETTRERFAEKALLAISRLSVTSPEYRALRARAYMMMGYRGVALKTLGIPESGEEHELRAVLDGNLPEVRAQALKERNPIKRLIAQLDANRIAAAYGVLTSGESIEAVKLLHLPGNVWPFLATRAFTDWDQWSQFDNASLKLLIDRELPIEGFSLQELMRGVTSIGDRYKLQSVVDLSVFNHARKYVQDHSPQCCDATSGRFTALDYMEFLSALGHDNIIRRIAFLANTQANCRAAIAYADSIQSVYKGYPYYALVRSEAEHGAAHLSGPAERDASMKLAYEDAFNAMYWEQGQSIISSNALTDLGSFSQHEYGYFDNFYYTDLPYHPLYRTWANGGNLSTIQANGLAALANATSQFGVVLELTGSNHPWPADDSLIAEILRQIQGRFIGNPQREAFLADQDVKHGNVAAAAALLREAIELAPAYGQSYLDLGKLTLESGQPNAAARIFHSYPGLRPDSSTDRVSIVQAASQMGGYFFSSGDFNLAIPFYRIAASQDTGAASEMSATMRLKLLAGDINGALLSSLERAQRYHDSRAYRDYLSMLHTTKHSQDAWAGFRTLVGELDDAPIWDSALVGHHMTGRTEAEVVEWAKQSDFRSAGNHVSHAITYLARFATTDRVPSEGLPLVIADLDRPTWQFEEGDRSVVRPDADGRDQRILGPAGAITAQGVLPIGVFDDGGPKHRVRSELSYFVEGYRDIKLRDFQGAKRVFDEAATLYDMASDQSTYMLPYYALASAKAGADVAGVEKILDRIKPMEQLFDYQLARAVIEAVGGRMSDALVSLKLARYRRTGAEDGVQQSQFTYGDVCESLYQLTGNPEIRRIALEWARIREKAEPWQSWSYALEASLTPISAERKRAIAMTYYLDPNSQHLSSFKKSEIDDAVSAFGPANIFLRKESAAIKGRMTS